MQNLVFEQTFSVEKHHTDAHQHVNNVTYLQWVQDISGAHWRHLASAALQQKYYWVALRHEIDYKNQAFVGEALLVRTQIKEMSGYKSIREVWVYKQAGQVLLMHALSTRCLMATASNKPCRIGTDFDPFITVQ
jgi:acyl-CoA thioester hydrolase